MWVISDGVGYWYYDDLEMYMEYGYVFVSSTGRNHAKMATLTSIKTILYWLISNFDKQLTSMPLNTKFTELIIYYVIYSKT